MPLRCWSNADCLCHQPSFESTVASFSAFGSLHRHPKSDRTPWQQNLKISQRVPAGKPQRRPGETPYSPTKNHNKKERKKRRSFLSQREVYWGIAEMCNAASGVTCYLSQLYSFTPQTGPNAMIGWVEKSLDKKMVKSKVTESI